MPSRSKKQRDVLKKRVRTLEAELLTLQPSQSAFKSNKKMLEGQLQLAKAELKTTRPTKSKAVRASGKTKGKASAVTPKTTPKKKRSLLPGGASFPSFQIPSPKSPTFYEDSLKAVGGLRNLAKSAMGYIQRADQLFDGLHGVGTHLHQAGVLPKLMQGKFKDLNTGEWGALLMALMNSPLSGMLLGGGSSQEAEGEQKALPEGTEHHEQNEQHTDHSAASHTN